MADEGASGSSTPRANNSSDEFIPGYKDVSSFSQEALQSVMGAIRSSNNLPAPGDDYDYYSSFPAFQGLMDIEGKRVLQLMQNILRHQGVKGKLQSSSECAEIEDIFDVLVDSNDQMLEQIGSALDEASGVKKKQNLVVATATPPQPKAAINTSWNKKASNNDNKKSTSYRLLAARFIHRPQLKFKDKIDNSSSPFVPKLTDKPNALKSLQESLTPVPVKIHDELGEEIEVLEYPNPYHYEQSHFQPTSEQLEKKDVVYPLPISDTTLTFVDNEVSLQKLCDALKTEKTIAVDLEHHSYRSFQGITCLMQLSTRRHDYIIDTLELRSELHVLNGIFTDPNVVKVFHGADMDIEWLQRDLGLYIVNMFDTHIASRVLGLARNSLAHLLKIYCDVEADKQYQLADWRMRPLPDELIKYAREDTHYLLYIYDKMRNTLIEKGNEQRNLIKSVLQRSADICMKVYKKPYLSHESHLTLYHKSKKVFNSQQMAALKDIYCWRDKISRMEDESTGYVLPNHMLLQIAELLPREAQGILACCNPIPPLVKQFLPEIHQMVLNSREVPLTKIEIPKHSLEPSLKAHPKYNVQSLLHCPHDTSHQVARQKEAEQSTTLLNLDPVLVATFSSMFKDQNTINLNAMVPMKNMPIISVFAWSPEAELRKSCTEAQRKATKIKESFVSPFEKYMPPSISRTPSRPKSGQKDIRLNSKSGDENSAVETPELVNTIDEKWKLLRNTENKEGEPEAPPPKEESEEEIDDTTLLTTSLRQQITKKKKRKPTETTSSEQEGNSIPKKKKSQKSKDNVSDEGETSTPTFQAFNYSRESMKIFEGDGGKKGNKEYKPQQQKKFKGGSKPRLNPSSGKKSMTYTHHGKGGNRQGNWPKR